MHFLYPADPMRHRAVEPMYAAEMDAIRAVGCSTSLCPDSAIDQEIPLRDVPSGQTVVYRGWMLNPDRYQRLITAISRAGALPLISLNQYLAAHHCPNWYPLIAEYTPQTHWFSVESDLEMELGKLGWDRFFLKDYVKSLKTSRGSILTDPSQVTEMICEMIKFRGEIEGGICVRQVEPFLTETERRYFVIRGNVFGPDGKPLPAIVNSVADRIPSSFFSVDVIEREDGVLRIVEIGDGQVSDLVGWTCEAFAKLWRTVKS